MSKERIIFDAVRDNKGKGINAADLQKILMDIISAINQKTGTKAPKFSPPNQNGKFAKNSTQMRHEILRCHGLVKNLTKSNNH